MGIAPVQGLERDAGDEDSAWLGDFVTGDLLALITTVDANGMIHTRQVPNTNPEFHGELWFLSAFGLPLLDEVRVHPDVLVTYADSGSGRYVVLNGVADVVRDPARLQAIWRPALASWFPGGPDDTALALIRVRIESADLWE
ncbi:MAG TPA: pyridoxamine 5'-phosphate oxidase family protein [Gemmatimonadales bacterium]|jgi:general stress protein 26|nr:pyridoxamine 5'-phosphate oxidase family protein [Gemmatimonadales bacterium]